MLNKDNKNKVKRILLKPSENNIELKVPEDIAVFLDSRTKARSFFVPLTFQTGVRGLITITKLENRSWTPSEEIESIIINWK